MGDTPWGFCSVWILLVARVLQSFLKSVNVIDPIAATGGTVGLIVPSVLPAGPPEPGWNAVPTSEAVSVTGWPRSTGVVPAWVASVGVKGVIWKHSLARLSFEPGTPSVVEVNSARQQ